MSGRLEMYDDLEHLRPEYDLRIETGMKPEICRHCKVRMAYAWNRDKFICRKCGWELTMRDAIERHHKPHGGNNATTRN